MRFRAADDGTELGFQLAPMVDIVFQALIFFMVVSVFAKFETSLDIVVPTAKTSVTSTRLPGEIIVNIDAEGRIVINRRRFTPEELKGTLARIAETFPGQPVILRADRQTPYEDVIGVLDACREADIWNVSFATLVDETAAVRGETAP
jgi:biopolymer transport protein ExbD